VFHRHRAGNAHRDQHLAGRHATVEGNAREQAARDGDESLKSEHPACGLGREPDGFFGEERQESTQSAPDDSEQKPKDRDLGDEQRQCSST